MYRTAYTLLVAVFLMAPCLAHGALIVVPDDQPTIQDGIDAAQNGDTVRVRPGTYNENIDFNGAAVLLQAIRGVDSTVIDGGAAGPAVTFTSGETDTSVIKAFRIRNGLSAQGGGIRCIGSSPTIAWCVIEDNVATQFGGGIYLSGSDANIVACEIYTNSAVSGGGLYIDNSHARVRHCRIVDNTVTQNGGGAACVNSSPNPNFRACEISLNTAVNGGAIWVGDSDPQGDGDFIVVCTIVANNAVNGGGIYIDNSTVRVFNILIRENTASTNGGALYIDNPADTVTMANSILWDNSSEVFEAAGTAAVNYCDIENWIGGGIGNQNVEPVFEWANGLDGIAGTKDDDHTLRPGENELLIDNGDPSDSFYDDFGCRSVWARGGVHNDIGGFGGPEVCEWDSPPPGGPVAAELVSFTAAGRPATVLLEWETASEIDSEGYHIWRALGEAEGFVRVTETLIPAEGNPMSGAVYGHRDEDVTNGQTYFYKLEELDIHGASHFHGPVSATPLAVFGCSPWAGNRALRSSSAVTSGSATVPLILVMILGGGLLARWARR